MQKIKIKVWNRLVMNNSEIAAEIPSSAENLRRWVAIYPNKGNYVDKTVPQHLYSVLIFELDRLLINEYVGDEDLIMINKTRYYTSSEDELYKILEELNVDPDLFDAPWNSEYPL